MNSDYATNDFIKRTYFQYTEDNVKERAIHKGKYRQMRDNFRSSSLQELNSWISSGKSYAFGLKASSAMLNKTTAKKHIARNLFELPPSTKNRLYVAITRARGNVYFINDF